MKSHIERFSWVQRIGVLTPEASAVEGGEGKGGREEPGHA